MKLTPIRVRGKKAARRPADDKGGAKASPTRSASPSAPAPKRQRTSSRIRNQKKQYVSFDQRLPLEVLESIYILSENVNLPLCSRRLHWLLSRRATRVELALAAFSPAWQERWDSSHPRPPGLYRERLPPGDPTFQAAVLRCAWVDVPLLVDAERLWQRRMLRASCGGCDSPNCAVVLILYRQHGLSRRSHLSTGSLAQKIGVDAQQAKAIERADLAQGCPRSRRSFWATNAVDSDDSDDSDDSYDSYDAPSLPLGQLPSVHVCFAAYALNATFNLTYYGDGNGIDWLHPFSGRHICMHPRTVIPEQLLLAHGAPAVAAAMDLDAAAVEECRARLQRSYELLLWLVDGCQRLQPTDSWEVTVEGCWRLLALAARAHRQRWTGDEHKFDESGARAEAEARAKADTRLILRLRIPVGELCTGMLGLFVELGVFTRQWPLAVLDEFRERMAELGTQDEVYGITLAFRYMTIIGNVAHREQEYELGRARYEAEQQRWLDGVNPGTRDRNES